MCKRTIIVDWNNRQSIDAAERRKQACENDGYTLADTKHNSITDISTLKYVLDSSL
jgi:hypothetical protein